MSEVNCTIVGVSPLLQHKFDNSKNGRPDPNLEAREIASWHLYKTDEGQIYQPSEHIEKAMQKAGTQFKFPGKGKKTYMDFIKIGVIIEPNFIIHKKQKWEVDERAVVVQRSRIMRLRPRFDDWELDFKIMCGLKEIDLKELNKILVYAGQFGGIGDYRPKYGRFMVTKYEIQ